MIPGRLSVVAAAISRRAVLLAARAGHRALERLAPASINTELAAAIATGMSRSDYLGPYSVPASIGEADILHHGSYELRICLLHNRVSVVPPMRGSCPECDPAPAHEDVAGDCPAAVSDGLATTAPAAGHPTANERFGNFIAEAFADGRLVRWAGGAMREAAAADLRNVGLINLLNGPRS
ncbi:hypothetical protein [Arthrobacter sp. SLBN-53]|uniref:hypothetical protein n=1 Tax=Arthrobacter sp. SLBN-53 TaxID=2768412 RepID=UPI001154C6E5|nr:hypothetical protein [Arthrobacter sp. SLBN-53]TQK29414.1 hypothetical protein FBY28_2417 [Arthrobacter sp. SLBN-53]